MDFRSNFHPDRLLDNWLVEGFLIKRIRLPRTFVLAVFWMPGLVLACGLCVLLSPQRAMWVAMIVSIVLMLWIHIAQLLMGQLFLGSVHNHFLHVTVTKWRDKAAFP